MFQGMNSAAGTSSVGHVAVLVQEHAVRVVPFEISIFEYEVETSGCPVQPFFVLAAQTIAFDTPLAGIAKFIVQDRFGIDSRPSLTDPSTAEFSHKAKLPDALL